MYSIQTDIHIARRQRLHLILDEHEVVAWTGKNITDALTWLLENGEVAVHLIGEDVSYEVTFNKLLD